MAERPLIGYDTKGRLDISRDRREFAPHPQHKGMMIGKTVNGMHIVTENPFIHHDSVMDEEPGVHINYGYDAKQK